MSLRRLEILQWVGLLAGALVWAAQHVVGFGITEAECNSGGLHWGIQNDVWQGALLIAAAACVIVAEAAAITVLVATRRGSYESPPAPGRVRFFAIAAAVSNVIFLMIIVLDGTAAILNVTCRQG
jgi:hypothetical protein